MPAESTWRAERSCPICWTTFTPAGPRHRYCSQRCRMTGHARRHAAPPTAGSTTGARPLPAPVVVRGCPHCGQEITIVALLTTPEAARPNLPGLPVGAVPLRRRRPT